MKNFKFFLGIDASKHSFDYCLLDEECVVYENGKVNNLSDTLKTLYRGFAEKHGSKMSLLTMFENTGIYFNPLARFLYDRTIGIIRRYLPWRLSDPKLSPEAILTVLMPGRLHFMD